MKTLVLCFGVLITLSSCAHKPLTVQVFQETEMIFVREGDRIVRVDGTEYIVPKRGAYMSSDVISAMGAKLEQR